MGIERVEAVITCEGNLSDPEFPKKFGKFLSKLSTVICQENRKEKLKVLGVEPWNSVRVKFTLPKDAAVRLRQLAQVGDGVLKELGILSVQLEGDQVISLTLAGREPQDIVFKTPAPAAPLPSHSLSGNNGAFAVVQPQPGPSNGPLPETSLAHFDPKNVSELLSQAVNLLSDGNLLGELGLPPVMFKTPAAPNVVASSSQPIQFTPPPKAGPSRAAFPFASMQQAMPGTSGIRNPPATVPPVTRYQLNVRTSAAPPTTSQPTFLHPAAAGITKPLSRSYSNSLPSASGSGSGSVSSSSQPGTSGQHCSPVLANLLQNDFGPKRSEVVRRYPSVVDTRPRPVPSGQPPPRPAPPVPLRSPSLAPVPSAPSPRSELASPRSAVNKVETEKPPDRRIEPERVPEPPARPGPSAPPIAPDRRPETKPISAIHINGEPSQRLDDRLPLLALDSAEIEQELAALEKKPSPTINPVRSASNPCEPFDMDGQPKSQELKKDETGGTGIKLRLKLGRSEPTTPSYTVDIVKDEPRVPPLCISLKNRNVTLLSPKKEEDSAKVKLKCDERKPKKRKVGSDSELELTVNCEVPGILKIKKPKLDDSLTKKSIDKKRLKKSRDSDAATGEEGRVPPLDLSSVPDYPAKPCDPSAAPRSLPACPDELEGLEGLANKAQHVRKEFLGTSLREGDHLARIGEKLKPNDKLYKISVLNSATRTLSESECETIRNTSQIEAYQMELHVKSDVVQSPVDSNNGNNQGEDSGIESMDALSEKSPNQGESPARLDLIDPNGPVTRTPDRKLSSPLHTSPKEDAFADLPSDLTLCSPQPFENSVTAVLTDELLSGRLTSENRESGMLPEEMLAVKLISEELEEYSRTVIQKECHSETERTEVSEGTNTESLAKPECMVEPSLIEDKKSEEESQFQVQDVTVSAEKVQESETGSLQQAVEPVALVPAETEMTSSESDAAQEFRTTDKPVSPPAVLSEQECSAAEPLQPPVVPSTDISERTEEQSENLESAESGTAEQVESEQKEAVLELDRSDLCSSSVEVTAAEDLPEPDLPAVTNVPSESAEESLTPDRTDEVKEASVEVSNVEDSAITVPEIPESSADESAVAVQGIPESVSDAAAVELKGADRGTSSEPVEEEKISQAILSPVITESKNLDLPHSSQPLSPKLQIEGQGCEPSVSPTVPAPPVITPTSPKAILQGQRTFVLPPGKKMVPIKLVTLPKGATPPTSLPGGPQFKVLVPMKSGTGVYYKSVVVSTASSDTVMAARASSPAESVQVPVQGASVSVNEPSKSVDSPVADHVSSLVEKELELPVLNQESKVEPILETRSDEVKKDEGLILMSPSKQAVDDLQVEHNYSCSSKSSEEVGSGDVAGGADSETVSPPLNMALESPEDSGDNRSEVKEGVVKKELEDVSSSESDVQISQASTEVSEVSSEEDVIISKAGEEAVVLEASSEDAVECNRESARTETQELEDVSCKSAECMDELIKNVEPEQVTEPELVTEATVSQGNGESDVETVITSQTSNSPSIESTGATQVKEEITDHSKVAGEQGSEIASSEKEDGAEVEHEDLTSIKSEDSTSPEMALNMKGAEFSPTKSSEPVKDEVVPASDVATSSEEPVPEDVMKVEVTEGEVAENSVKEHNVCAEEPAVFEKVEPENDNIEKSDVEEKLTVTAEEPAIEVNENSLEQPTESETIKDSICKQESVAAKTTKPNDQGEANDGIETERLTKLDIELPTVCVDEQMSEVNGTPKKTKRLRCSKTPEVEDFKTPIEDFLLDIPEPVLRSTRSGTRLVSPDLSKLEAKFAQIKSSPSPGPEPQPKRGVRRKREDSGSSLRSDDRNSNTPDSEISGPSHSTRSNTPEIGRPGKRKCSENASELIKACMGVDDRRRSTLQGDVGEGEQKRRTASGENAKTQRNNDISKVLEEDADDDSDTEKKSKSTAAANAAAATAKKARGTRPITSSANKTAASKIASSKDSENSPRKSRRGSTDSTASGGQPAATPNDRRTRSTPMKSRNKTCGQSTPDKTAVRKGALSGVASTPRSTPKRRVK